MPKTRATPEALLTTSMKMKLKDLARRRKQANGNILLMPQAEETITEAGSTNKHIEVPHRNFETWKAHATKAGYHVSKIKTANPDEHVHVAHKQERLDPQRELNHVPGQRWRGIFWHNSHIPGLKPNGYLRTKYIPEDAGGLGYAAPSTGNGNYAVSLPSGTGTTDQNKAIKQVHKRVPKVTQQSDTTPLSGLKEGAFKEKETDAQDDAYALGHSHGYNGGTYLPPKHHADHYHEGYASGKFARSEDSINDEFTAFDTSLILEASKASPEYLKWKQDIAAKHGEVKYKTRPHHTKTGWDYVTTAHKDEKPVDSYSHSHVKAVLAGKHGEEARKKMAAWTNEELIHEAKGGLVIIHPDHQHEYPHLIGKRMYKAGPSDKGHSDVFVHTSTHNVDLHRIPNKHLKVPSQKDYNHFFDSRRKTNEAIIVSVKELEPIFEAYKKGKRPTPTAAKGMADDAGILEGMKDDNRVGWAYAYREGLKHGKENNPLDRAGSKERFGDYSQRYHEGVRDAKKVVKEESALELGAIHGLRGHELPKVTVTTKFGRTAQNYYKGIEQGKKERERRDTPKKGFLHQMVGEELKVGEGVDGPDQNRVKRKYLGTKRGRTATGKPAHAIEVMPVLARPDKNVNKTTPGSPLKRT
jgi:hypothetical protein